MDDPQNEPCNQRSSMTSLIIWNISKVLEKNPNIDLQAAIKSTQTKIDLGDNLDVERIVSEKPEERYLVCTLLAWQEMGHSDPDALYRFIQSHITTGRPVNYNNPYSSLRAPFTNISVEPQIVMQCTSIGKKSHKKSPIKKTPPKNLLEKVNEICCMDKECSETLQSMDSSINDLRGRAENLVKRDAERVLRLERAETFWQDLELGFQKRLHVAKEKEDDYARQIRMLSDERATYKNACSKLATMLKELGAATEKERSKLGSLEQTVCNLACQKHSLMSRSAKQDAALADHLCKCAQLERDLKFQEEQAKRNLSSMEGNVESTRALTYEMERTMRSELKDLRDQAAAATQKLLKEDADNSVLKKQVDDLMKEKERISENLRECKAISDKTREAKLEELKQKKARLKKLEKDLLECRCKNPVDISVQVQRTASFAALCRCSPEDRLPESCSCSSLRSKLLATTISDLFGGLHLELGDMGIDLPCQLLKCLEDGHNWEKTSTVKTNLRNYFANLLNKELDIAVTTSMEKYHAKWVTTTCVDLGKQASDPNACPFCHNRKQRKSEHEHAKANTMTMKHDHDNEKRNSVTQFVTRNEKRNSYTFLKSVSGESVCDCAVTKKDKGSGPAKRDHLRVQDDVSTYHCEVKTGTPWYSLSTNISATFPYVKVKQVPNENELVDNMKTEKKREPRHLKCMLNNNDIYSQSNRSKKITHTLKNNMKNTNKLPYKKLYNKQSNSISTSLNNTDNLRYQSKNRTLKNRNKKRKLEFKSKPVDVYSNPKLISNGIKEIFSPRNFEPKGGVLNLQNNLQDFCTDYPKTSLEPALKVSVTTSCPRDFVSSKMNRDKGKDKSLNTTKKDDFEDKHQMHVDHVKATKLANMVPPNGNWQLVEPVLYNDSRTVMYLETKDMFNTSKNDFKIVQESDIYNELDLKSKILHDLTMKILCLDNDQALSSGQKEPQKLRKSLKAHQIDLTTTPCPRDDVKSKICKPKEEYQTVGISDKNDLEKKCKRHISPVREKNTLPVYYNDNNTVMCVKTENIFNYPVKDFNIVPKIDKSNDHNTESEEFHDLTMEILQPENALRYKKAREAKKNGPWSNYNKKCSHLQLDDPKKLEEKNNTIYIPKYNFDDLDKKFELPLPSENMKKPSDLQISISKDNNHNTHLNSINKNNLNNSDIYTLHAIDQIEQQVKEHFTDFNINEFYMACEDQKVIFLKLLHKLKNLILNKVKCISDDVSINDKTNRAFKLLKNYLLMKVRRLQYLCDSEKENGEKEINEKIFSTIRHDFQRLHFLLKHGEGQ